MDYKEIYNKINNLERGCYFIYGDEDYFINTILDNVNHNQNLSNNVIYTYYGESCNFESVLKEVYQQSIFDDFNVVIIKNAENNKFLDNKDNSEYIKNYINNFTANAILLIVYNKNLTKTSNLLNIFSKSYVFNSKKLVSNQIKTFIKDYCKENNKILNDDDVDLLYECYGDNISQIIAEINKGFNKDNVKYSRQFNSFEFLNAIITKNYRKISLIVNNFDKSNQYEIIPLLGLLFSFFSKLLAFINSKNKESYPFIYHSAVKNFTEEKVIKIINELQYCDECIKGVNSYIFDYFKVLKYISAVIIN